MKLINQPRFYWRFSDSSMLFLLSFLRNQTVSFSSLNMLRERFETFIHNQFAELDPAALAAVMEFGGGGIWHKELKVINKSINYRNSLLTFRVLFWNCWKLGRFCVCVFTCVRVSAPRFLLSNAFALWGRTKHPLRLLEVFASSQEQGVVWPVSGPVLCSHSWDKVSHWFGWWVQSYTWHPALSSNSWPFGPAQPLIWSWREQKVKQLETKWHKSSWSFCSALAFTLPLSRTKSHPNWPSWHWIDNVCYYCCYYY